MTDIAAWSADIRPAPGCGWFHPMSAYPTHCARCTVTRRMRQGGCYVNIAYCTTGDECLCAGNHIPGTDEHGVMICGGGWLECDRAPDLAVSQPTPSGVTIRYSHGCWDPECTLCGGRLREAVTSGGGELVASGAPDLRRRGVNLTGLPALLVPREVGRVPRHLEAERLVTAGAPAVHHEHQECHPCPVDYRG